MRSEVDQIEYLGNTFNLRVFAQKYHTIFYLYQIQLHNSFQKYNCGIQFMFKYLHIICVKKHYKHIKFYVRLFT